MSETAFLGVGGFNDAGILIMDVTNSCSDVCPADLNGDGSLNFFDISTFLGDLPDFNNDGRFNFFDISAFLSAFAAGCQ